MPFGNFILTITSFKKFLGISNELCGGKSIAVRKVLAPSGVYEGRVAKMIQIRH